MITLLSVFVIGCQKNIEDSNSSESNKNVESKSEVFSEKEVEAYLGLEEKIFEVAEKYNDDESVIDSLSKKELIQEIEKIIVKEETYQDITYYECGRGKFICKRSKWSKV